MSELKSVVVRVSPEIHKALRIYAATESTSIGALLEAELADLFQRALGFDPKAERERLAALEAKRADFCERYNAAVLAGQTPPEE